MACYTLMEGELRGEKITMTYNVPTDARDAETFVLRVRSADNATVLDDNGNLIKPRPVMEKLVVEGEAEEGKGEERKKES